MPAQSGQLDRTITLQANTPTRDTVGASIPGWATLATVSAAVEPLSGSEVIAAQQIGTQQAQRFRIRYRADVTTLNRLVYNSVTYGIISVMEDGRREWLLILAIAKVT